jgi:hypothetical protein
MLQWTRIVTEMVEARNTCKNLVGNFLERDLLEDGKYMKDNNIKMCVREMDCELDCTGPGSCSLVVLSIWILSPVSG